jgi:hypothetical protein
LQDLYEQQAKNPGSNPSTHFVFIFKYLNSEHS